RQLEQRANQLAHYLGGLGVGPDACVGLYLERSPWLLVAMLGVLKAGGAYLPLEPTTPPERLHFMLGNAGAVAGVTEAALAGGLAGPRPALCLDTQWSTTLAGQSAARPLSAVTAAHLAYVIYTSGSTGRPKGVALAHTGLVNLVAWHQRTYQVTAPDR